MLEESSRTTAYSLRVAQPQLRFSSPGHESKQTRVFCGDVLIESRDYLERCARTSLISLFAHIGAMAALVALPVFTWIAPPPVPYPRGVTFLTPPPPRFNDARPHAYSQGFAQRALPSLRLIPPVLPPRRSALDPTRLPLTPNLLAPGITLGSDGVFGGIVPGRPARLVSSTPPENVRVLHQGGEIKNSRPLYKLTLPYPALAKAARIIGRVVIQAVIDETGKVVHVRAVSGPFLLSAAAIEAVSKERFQPVLLDGQPIRSELQVQISFNLSGGF